MKKIIILLFVLFTAMNVYGIETINTNDAITPANVIAQFEQAKGIVIEWKAMIEAIKSGFSWPMLIALAILLISTIAAIGVLFVALLKLIAIFTPDNIDEKLQVIEDFITKYIIKISITILGKIRTIRKKE